MDNQDQSISLNKYISSTGICSRREADRWIEQGRVKLNGKTAAKGNRVFEGDTVLLNGKKIASKPKPVYLAFNKPVGIVCTTDEKEANNIISYIDYHQRLFPIGRLDKPSEGLIFLTNDGDIVNKILRAGNQHQKEYIVRVDKLITPEFLKKMGDGIPILDTTTLPCEVYKVNKKTFKIILTQGLNRQIRRMCEYLGYEVKKLTRVRIMNVKLGKLAIGHYRNLTKREIQEIQELVSSSSKTSEASIPRKRSNKPKKSNSKGNRFKR